MMLQDNVLVTEFPTFKLISLPTRDKTIKIRTQYQIKKLTYVRNKQHVLARQ